MPELLNLTAPALWQTVAACFTIASLGGLATLLRSTHLLTLRNISATMLHSGLVGATVCLCWFNYFDGANKPSFALFASSLAGLSGAALLDLVTQVIARGGVKIIVSPKDEE